MDRRIQELPRFSPEAERFFQRYRQGGDIFWHELPDRFRLIVWDAMIVARRDWSVRVLDAYVRTLSGGSHWSSNEGTCGIWDGYEEDRNARNPNHWHGCDEDAARLAAALAVVVATSLDARVRAELGECP